MTVCALEECDVAFQPKGVGRCAKKYCCMRHAKRGQGRTRVKRGYFVKRYHSLNWIEREKHNMRCQRNTRRRRVDQLKEAV